MTQYDSPPAMTIDPSASYTATFKTNCGAISVELLAAQAPVTVNNFVFLAREGFYDEVIFHRIIAGFMLQGGDPTGTGRGSSMYPDLPAEFTDKLSFGRGTAGLARSSSPDSGNSQFFIMFAPGSFLNGQYTVWGQVIDGMDKVDAITRGEPPRNPDKMVDVYIAADKK